MDNYITYTILDKFFFNSLSININILRCKIYEFISKINKNITIYLFIHQKYLFGNFTHGRHKSLARHPIQQTRNLFIFTFLFINILFLFYKYIYYKSLKISILY